jgi:hypothetical protein
VDVVTADEHATVASRGFQPNERVEHEHGAMLVRAAVTATDDSHREGGSDG